MTNDSGTPQLPKWGRRLLNWFCDPELLEDVEGDLSELYSLRSTVNPMKAKWLFWADLLLLFRPGIVKKFGSQNQKLNTTMLNNYFKTAYRNSIRFKAYTALNLLGLILGIASSLLIFLWVQDEVAMDKFHEDGDKVYQLFRNMRQTGGIVNTTFTIPKPMADLMREEYSEVDQVAQLSWPVEALLSTGDNPSKVEGRFATPEFLDLFTYPMIIGDKLSALEDMNSILISESMAIRFFGDDWKAHTLGKSIRLDNEADAIVTGVFQDPGSNSSLDFDWLRPAEAFFVENDWVEDWGNGNFNIFFTLKDERGAEKVAERVYGEILDHTKDNGSAGDETLIMVKYSDRYLYSNFVNGEVSGGRIVYVRILSVVGIFVLLIAAINFMNLATARSNRRSKEVGVRKVMGANKRSVAFQFLFESVLISALAVFISVLVVLLLMPSFNLLVNKVLVLDLLSLQTWLLLLALVLVIGLLSGSYAAFLLPSLKIDQALKGQVKQSNVVGLLRKGLVVFQFAITALLMIGTLVIYQQLSFVLTKDLGLDKDRLLMVPLEGQLSDKWETYKNELKSINGITSVAFSSGNPINYGRSTSSATWKGKDPEAGYEVNVMLVDKDFIGTMGMEMTDGRDFDHNMNDERGYIINEVAADLIGYEEPIGEFLSFWGQDGKIIGVVKDFHMRDLYEPISPLIITSATFRPPNVALIRFDGSTQKVLTAVESVTQDLNPSYDFDYAFLDQSYADGYEAEFTVRTLALIFSILSIIISGMGLYGLSAYTTEQRSREIGVRKVHGASTGSIVGLLTKEYSLLMVLAFVLSGPIAYYVADAWLSNFQFRMELKWWIFLAVGVATLLIGLLSVGYKSYKAAAANPILSLKDE